MDLARGDAAREVRDEGVGELVEERVVELGRQRGGQAADGEAHAAVEAVVLAARPRRRAGRVVVALRREAG